MQVPDEARAATAAHSKYHHGSQYLQRHELQFSRQEIAVLMGALQVLFATGDVMAQQAVERVGFDKHNLARTGRMALYGGGASSSNPAFPSMETLN